MELRRRERPVLGRGDAQHVTPDMGGKGSTQALAKAIEDEFAKAA